MARLLASPRVDPGAKSNRALQNAAKHGEEAIALLLLADPRVDPAALDPPEFAAFRARPRVAEALRAARARRRWTPLRAAWAGAVVAGR